MGMVLRSSCSIEGKNDSPTISKTAGNAVAQDGDFEKASETKAQVYKGKAQVYKGEAAADKSQAATFESKGYAFKGNGLQVVDESEDC